MFRLLVAPNKELQILWLNRQVAWNQFSCFLLFASFASSSSRVAIEVWSWNYPDWAFADGLSGPTLSSIVFLFFIFDN